MDRQIRDLAIRQNYSGIRREEGLFHMVTVVLNEVAQGTVGGGSLPDFDFCIV